MNAGDLTLWPSPFDYVPPVATQARRRHGFSCHRDFPDDPPCGCMACSACTKVFRDNVGPQILRATATGRWERLHLIDRTLRFTDEALANLTKDDLADLERQLRDKIRAAYKAKGLDAPQIIAAFDFSRETTKENGIEIDHWWSPHLHGSVEVTQGKDRIDEALTARFWTDPTTPRPVMIDPITDHAGWIGYFLKDPRDMCRRVHLRWTSKPQPRREAAPRTQRKEYPTPRRPLEPKKQPMSPGEAEPLMRFLDGILVHQRLFLMGYQFQGGFLDGQLIQRPTGAAHQGLTDTPLKPSRNGFKQGPRNSMDDGHKHTDGYASFMHRRALFADLQRRWRNSEPRRPAKLRPLK